MSEQKPTLDQMIASMKEREKGDIDRKVYEMEKYFQFVPALIAKTSELTGIAPRRLVRLASLTAMQFEGYGLNPHLILAIVETFYIYDQNSDLMRGFGDTEAQ